MGILCIPAHSELDDVMCTMVHLLMAAQGAQVGVVHAPSPHDLEKVILDKGVHCICICALSPQSAMRSIAWSRVLRHRFPDLGIVIGLWNAQTQASSRFAKAKTRYRIAVATSIKEAVMMLTPAVNLDKTTAQTA